MYFNTAKANNMIIGNKIVIGEFSRNAVSLNGTQTVMTFGDTNIDTNIYGGGHINMAYYLSSEKYSIISANSKSIDFGNSNINTNFYGRMINITSYSASLEPYNIASIDGYSINFGNNKIPTKLCGKTLSIKAGNSNQFNIAKMEDSDSISFGNYDADTYVVGKNTIIESYQEKNGEKTRKIYISLNSNRGNVSDNGLLTLYTDDLELHANYTINLNAKKSVKINSSAYGTTLPTTDNTTGRLFFKIVD